MYKVISLCVTPFQQNCRILGDPVSRQAVVIDPGGDVALITEALSRESLNCREIWLTHSHLDHCGGVQELIEQSGAKLLAHASETLMRQSVEELCVMYGIANSGLRNCPEPDRYLHGDETLSFAGFHFKVLYTPGHSPGHVVFFDADNRVLVAGDLIFAGSVGRTDLPGGDYNVLMQSLRLISAKLPPETKVLPGHGPDTTLAHELESNPFMHSL